MRLMTTNIWGDYFDNPVDVREDNMYKVYENYSPDVIGFQEVNGKIVRDSYALDATDHSPVYSDIEL